jgi:hypothetical protein
VVLELLGKEHQEVLELITLVYLLVLAAEAEHLELDNHIRYLHHMLAVLEELD